MNVFWRAVDVSHCEGFLAFDLGCSTNASFSSDAVEPAYHCIVVMSTRVCDAMFGEVVGQVLRRTIATSEAKLNYSHSRELKSIAQLMNFLCDKAKIFGNHRESPRERTLKGMKQIISWTRLPFSNACVRQIGWNLPIGFEASKVVDPNQIA